MKWQQIDEAKTGRYLLWIADPAFTGAVMGLVFENDGLRTCRPDGFHGEFEVTHFAKITPPKLIPYAGKDDKRRREMSMVKNLTVYGGCYDGKNRIFVAAPTKKRAHEAVRNAIGGLSYYSWNQYTADSSNDYEVSIAVTHPLCVYKMGVNDKDNAKMIWPTGQ